MTRAAELVEQLDVKLSCHNTCADSSRCYVEFTLGAAREIRALLAAAPPRKAIDGLLKAAKHMRDLPIDCSQETDNAAWSWLKDAINELDAALGAGDNQSAATPSDVHEATPVDDRKAGGGSAADPSLVAELPSYSAELLAANYPNRRDDILSGPYTPRYLAEAALQRSRDEIVEQEFCRREERHAFVVHGRQQQERIAALEAELATCVKQETHAYAVRCAEEARKDAERIDWLQSQTAGDVTLCPPGNHGGDKSNWLCNVARDFYGEHSDEWEAATLREAIDAARGAEHG